MVLPGSFTRDSMNKQLYFYVNVKTYIDIIILLSRIIFVPSIKLNITFNKYISIISDEGILSSWGTKGRNLIWY
jgi:hypothetical protein